MTEDEYYRIVGERIQHFRRKRDLTQEDLSIILILSRPSIANMEAGRHRIQLFVLYQIAEVLDVPLIELIV